MKHLIVGAGYFGYNLAVSLANKGEDVIVLEKEAEKLNVLRDVVSKAIQVDATDKEMLKKVVPTDVQQAVVCIGRNLEANLVVCLLLKDFGLQRIIAKCHSPEHEKLLRMMGVDFIVDPEKQMAEHLADRLVDPDIIDYIPLESGFKVVKAHPPKVFLNKKLKELDIRNKYKINIIGIKKKKGNFYDFDIAPSADTIFLEEDIIIAAGKTEDIEKLF
jgi:trk system potassium uptake protein